MFDRILVANRGEIACRVIETARRMGVATVAVHSDADAASRHVRMADAAVCIGGAAPADSYLRIDAVVAAALDEGAQAIHPGYGFLSENPDFAKAVEAAGLVFVGPSADAMAAMGLKDSAKRLMEQAGVPVVPGLHDGEDDPERLRAGAERIGYPVLIKAVAGGGGRGMRLVAAPEAFDEALESARAEAKAAFGNDRMLVEKFVERPRHIEFQIFGDGERAVHLFERDCSLQRRHQKVIEEAPAPGMTPQTRQAMGEAAVRAAESVGYRGAGTVEFIADGSRGLRPDGFWFMEMNTRLQVEHPVSEAIAGVDLVEWQLRVAAGEPLPARQEDLRIDGHAFEARICAEDASKGFLPSTGRIARLAFAAGARVDTGVEEGDSVTPHYDPMIAKLIVHGADRDAALAKLRRALDGCRIAGVSTNLAFLGALAAHGEVVAGNLDTGIVERDLDDLAAPPQPRAEDAALAALAAAGLLDADGAQMGFALWEPLARTVALRHAGAEIPVRITSLSRDAHDVEALGAEVQARRGAAGWTLNGATAPETAVAAGRVTVLARFGLEFAMASPGGSAAGGAAAGDVIEAPMPGLVREVLAAPGQRVRRGERLASLEAMKMEHALRAERDGVVAEVLVEAGAQVEAGAALVRLGAEVPEGEDG